VYGALLLLSSCSQDSARGAVGDCAEVCPNEAPKIDFSADKSSYSAHLRVADGSGKPVAKARVEVAERSATTDADGRVVVKNVDARTPATLKVSSDNAAPHFARTDAWKSGQTTQNVTLLPLATKARVDLERPLVVQKDFGRLSVAARSLAVPDGRRAEKATLEMADLLGPQGKSKVWLRDLKAVDRQGAPALLERLEAMIHVRFTSDDGQTLQLAATKTAILELKLPADSDAKPGEKRSLWSLDEKALILREEGACVVAEQKLSGEKSGHLCKGPVSHFSVWAVASAPPADEPPALTCLNVRPSAVPGACFKVEVEKVFLSACDAAGDKCAEASYRDALFADGGGAAAAYCGVLEWSPSYRVAVLYDVDVSACADQPQLEAGRRIKLSEPLSADIRADAELLAAFSRDPQDVCASQCSELALRIDEEDLAEPMVTDHDNDGHYAGAGDGALFPGGSADCDDRNAQVHPGAPELFCGDVDRDCDGERPPAARTPSALDDAVRWNAQCALCGASIDELGELPGNLLDEDCDGSARDRDDDGYAEPDDHDDFSQAVAPGLAELPGNTVDEDGDGVSLDWDGDGMPAPSHLYLTQAAGIDATLFVDCNDYDADTHPGAADARNACQIEWSAESCPTFDWSGAAVQTTCEEAVDSGQGTGNGVCAFGGWWDGSPPSQEAGALWGPCDGGALLPACAPDAQCGGPLPYASELVDYLDSVYTHGTALVFHGMCFPKCSL
jgi:hypothetical protein